MTGIVSFEDVHDMHTVARDFSRSLSMPENNDIALDFPGTVRRYTGDVDTVYDELMKTKEQCKAGVREQFISFAGETAVGLSAIQLVEQPPEGVDTAIPNWSGMVMNPWRGRGFGLLALRYGLDIVDERFNGKAYSVVRKENVASQRLVESNGLVVISEDEGRLTYLYDSQNQ